jgi:peroxiredoxin
MSSNPGPNALAGALILSGLVWVLASCGSGPGAVGSGEESGVDFDMVVSGRDAPDFALEALDGSTVRLSDLAGQVRLIDFWATWCVPCREEIPMFMELLENYGPQGFTILAISDENSSIVRDFVESNAIPYPNLIDSGEVSEKYGVLALPSAFLVDREGKIVESFMGPKPRKVLEAKIRELLEAPPST